MSQKGNIKTQAIVLFVLVLALLILASAALAQSSNGDYSLIWWTVDGGGDTSGNGEGYSLSGTIGQHDAGMLTGGNYTLVGGFWGGVALDYKVHLPLILKGH